MFKLWDSIDYIFFWMDWSRMSRYQKKQQQHIVKETV